LIAARMRRGICGNPAPALAEAPEAYSMFQKKEDGAIKVVLKP
jgi:threonine dehydrogenase-like Zn-dependent dehydrogenase